MSKANRPPMSKEEHDAVLEYLKSLPPPKPVPCSLIIRSQFDTVVLPALKDQALSELRRNNQFPPRLIGFMDDGSMGIVDVGDAFGGTFGPNWTKDATARVHQFAAKIPGVRMSVFCVETWMLRRDDKRPKDLQYDKSKGIADHPDREEAVMFDMLHYDPRTGELMQMMTLIHVIKVLGHNTSPSAWRDTKYGEMEQMDPNALADGMRYEGRFVVGKPGSEQ